MHVHCHGGGTKNVLQFNAKPTWPYWKSMGSVRFSQTEVLFGHSQVAEDKKLEKTWGMGEGPF